MPPVSLLSNFPNSAANDADDRLAPLSTAVGLVLAGGYSTRMGEDKALLQVDQQPLLARVCQAALVCVPQVSVVTPWPQRYDGILPPGCDFIPEDRWPLPGTDLPMAQGPLVGFTQGLRQVKADWVLLLACDLPHLDGVVLRQWATQLEQVPEDAIALLPQLPTPHHSWEPLCGFYRGSCAEDLEAFIASGGRSFQRWLEHHKVVPILDFDPQMVFNCNTPTDLDRAQHDDA